MTIRLDEHRELLDLLDRLCEDRLDAVSAERLEALAFSDREARQLYLDYLNLHGSLHWDAANGTDAPSNHLIETVNQTAPVKPVMRPARAPRTARVLAGWTAALVCLVAIGWFVLQPGDNTNPNPIADNSTPERKTEDKPIPPGPGPVIPPKRINPPVVVHRDPLTAPFPKPFPRRNPGPIRGVIRADIVSFIDEQLRDSWKQNAITASPRASDAEWIRRVYLDLVGRIPTSDAVEQFLANRDPHKRRDLVEDLLASSEYGRHMATMWTNLLIGRRENGQVDRAAFFQYLSRSFGRNQPWSETVAQLIGAQGSIIEQPAANFLVAHLNDQAVPATAFVSRVFMGTQMQCAQCHDHPLIPTMKQDRFWALNGFFKGTEIKRKRIKDDRTGKVRVVPELVTAREHKGLTFFEDRKGVMKAVLPAFEKFKLGEEYDGDRRAKLAEILTRGDETLVAKAFVNRVWSQFFGAGFTRPIDDLGPHNPPSHPELLDELTRQFIKSRYDVKRLIRWITTSEAYQLTSRKTDANDIDSPEIGNMPLFSRVYVKPMSPEQVYDSLILAGSKDHTPQIGWKKARELRQTWIRQFVHSYQTEENDESSLFDGTIPQALQMMNGDLVEEALQLKEGTFLNQVASMRRTLETKTHRLALAALSRKATPKEIAAVKSLARQKLAAMPQKNIASAQAMALQDLFWAYLNSSEFILVH